MSKKPLKPYNFVEYRYPEDDPNIDLNFENDILYSAVKDDDLDKYNTINAILPEIPPSKNEIKKSIKKEEESNSNKIYIIFILLVIILIIIWYMYSQNSVKKKTNVIDTYADQPEITMMSPDFGLGTRYKVT